MSYTPTEWQCGDVITAEKLNKLENGLADCCGGGNEPLIFTISNTEVPCPQDPSQTATTVKYTYSHSWQEIYDALASGKRVIYKEVYDEDYGRGIAIYHFDSVSYEPEGFPDTPYIGTLTRSVLNDPSIEEWVVIGAIVRFSDATSKEFIEPCGTA